MNRERKELREQTGHLLQALGDNADQVAASLRAHGVSGAPRSPQGCAIAVYVSAVVGADRRVNAVAVHNTGVLIRPSSRWRPPVAVPLPAPVKEFIIRFDRGGFPALARRDPAPQPQGPAKSPVDIG